MTSTNWTNILNEAQFEAIAFARGQITLRDFISSVGSQDNRRQLYFLEKNGGTKRARSLARRALCRRGYAI